jgi:hypothetical protein
MPSTPSASTPAAPARRPWRQILLWGVFALTLGAGLVLAALYGADAPVLLEPGSR